MNQRRRLARFKSQTKKIGDLQLQQRMRAPRSVISVGADKNVETKTKAPAASTRQTTYTQKSRHGIRSAVVSR